MRGTTTTIMSVDDDPLLVKAGRRQRQINAFNFRMTFDISGRFYSRQGVIHYYVRTYRLFASHMQGRLNIWRSGEGMMNTTSVSSFLNAS